MGCGTGDHWRLGVHVFGSLTHWPIVGFILADPRPRHGRLAADDNGRPATLGRDTNPMWLLASNYDHSPTCTGPSTSRGKCICGCGKRTRCTDEEGRPLLPHKHCEHCPVLTSQTDSHFERWDCRVKPALAWNGAGICRERRLQGAEQKKKRKNTKKYKVIAKRLKREVSCLQYAQTMRVTTQVLSTVALCWYVM